MNVTVSVADECEEANDVDEDFETEVRKEPKSAKVSIIQDIQVNNFTESDN